VQKVRRQEIIGHPIHRCAVERPVDRSTERIGTRAHPRNARAETATDAAWPARELN